jgi:hypothetical protein
MGFEMTTLYVTQPFTLICDDGKRQFFDAGVQDVEDDIAAHWYVQAHCIEKPVAAPEPVRWPEPISEAERSHAQTAEPSEDAEASVQTTSHAQTAPQKSEPAPAHLKSGKKAKP